MTSAVVRSPGDQRRSDQNWPRRVTRELRLRSQIVYLVCMRLVGVECFELRYD
jgi:hypothetical protein